MIICEGTIEIIQKGSTFTQLITTSGLSAVMSGGVTAATAKCKFGVGTTPPSISNTTLSAPLSPEALRSTSNTGTILSYPFGATFTSTYVFPVGSFTGESISEVGFLSTGNVLFSRTLIKDRQGNPTTIRVLNNEAITVVYTIRKFGVAPTMVPITPSVIGSNLIVAGLSSKQANSWGVNAGINFTRLAFETSTTLYPIDTNISTLPNAQIASQTTLPNGNKTLSFLGEVGAGTIGKILVGDANNYIMQVSLETPLVHSGGLLRLANLLTVGAVNA